jgi:hypothetical protein
VNGVAKTRDYAHRYISTGEVGESEHLEALEASLGTLHFFCINDTTDDATPCDPRLTKVRETLQSMFALPSSFEEATIGYD